jgi:hypothetical protein
MGSRSATVARTVNGALSTLGDTKLESEHLMEIVFNLVAVCEDGSRGILQQIYAHMMGCESQHRDDANPLTSTLDHEEDREAQAEAADAYSRIADRVNAAIEHDWNDWFLTGEST